MAVEVPVLQAPAQRDADAPARGQPYRIRVYGKWCKGCGLCIAFCPRNVFEADEEHHPIVMHPERCNACNWCATHCPDFAILVEKAGDVKGQVGK